MSLSLREQLLKAGLVTEQQVKRAEHEQHRGNARPPGKQGRQPPGPSPREIAARRAAAEKAARDAELDRARQQKAREKAERRAAHAQVRQLVQEHQVPRVETEDFYNFVDGQKIGRIEVTPELRQRLIAGELGIVRSEGRYAFVPAAIAEQVRQKVARALIHLNLPQAPPDPDDPYKDHVVPDDLTW
ncbi:MAG: DUF2058 domain-containing protein [Nevskiaceae bacterium]|jgi:uncharacterized protein YaiL (DUF2058 family)|nr:DUF2058 domain-containing protein [Nevskiaceae bacterium]